MGILPYEDQMVTGVITKGEGYEPSAGGTTVYLNGGDNLQNHFGQSGAAWGRDNYVQNPARR